MLSRFRNTAVAVLLFVLAGIAAAQTPITGTFTLSGSPVANGTVSFVLQNCGLSPTVGSTSYNATLSAAGVISTSVQGNAGNGCSLSGGVNVSYFKVTLTSSTGNLIWQRNYQIPVQTGAFNLATAASMTTLPPPLSNGATGATGPTGATGTAATIAIGTVTAVPPGQAPDVQNVGNPTAAVLDFKIPSGGASAAGSPLQIQVKNQAGNGLDAANFQTDVSRSDLLGVRNLSATNIAPSNPLALLNLPGLNAVTNDYVARNSQGNPRSDFADQSPFHLRQNVNRRWGCCDGATALSIDLSVNSGFENVETNFMNYSLLALNYVGHAAVQGGGAWGYAVHAHGIGDTVGTTNLLFGTGTSRAFDEALEPHREFTAFEASIFGGTIHLQGTDSIGSQKMQLGGFGDFGYDPSAASEQRLLIDVSSKWQAGTYNPDTTIPGNTPINIFDYSVGGDNGGPTQGAIVGTTGAVDTTATWANYSPMMNLRGATQWTSNSPMKYYTPANYGFAYYDINQNYISGDVGSGDSAYPANTVFNVPTGAVYLRVTMRPGDFQPLGIGNYSQIMILAGPVVPGSYLAYNPTRQWGTVTVIPGTIATAGSTTAVDPVLVDGNFVKISADTASGITARYGVSTIAHLTAPVDSNVYTGTCPNVVNTGTSPGDAFIADAQGNLLTPATANYCTTINSTSGMTPGTLIAVADASLNMEYTTVISVVDATHFTAAFRHPHSTGAMVSWGGGVGYAWSSQLDDRAPHTEDSVQNTQTAKNILAYPIMATLTNNQFLVYVNVWGGGAEVKSHSPIFNAPVTPLVISSPVVTGGVLTSFTANNDANNYVVTSQTPGHPQFLPPPAITFGGSSACTTNPVIKFKRSQLETNASIAYNPYIVSGGTGCPSDLTVNVSPTVPQPFNIYPITWIYRVEDSTGNPNAGFIRTEPIVTTAWHEADQAMQSMWWNRYMGSQEMMTGDDIVTHSGRFGDLKSYFFRDVQSGALESLINQTPAWKYIGLESNNWVPTGIDSQNSPPIVRRVSGLYSIGTYFDTPPILGSGSAQRAPGLAGGTLFWIGCGNNNSGSAATHCNAATPIYDPFRVFDIWLGGTSKRMTMSVDPNTGIWSVAPTLLATDIEAGNLIIPAGFPTYPDPSALSIQNRDHYTVMGRNTADNTWSSDSKVSAGEYTAGLLHAGANVYGLGTFASGFNGNAGNPDGNNTTYAYSVTCSTGEGETLPTSTGTAFGAATLNSTKFLVIKGNTFEGGCQSGNVYRTTGPGGVGFICSFLNGPGNIFCSDTGQAADTAHQPPTKDTSGSFQIGQSQKIKAITGNATSLFAHSGPAGGAGNIVSYDTDGNAHNSTVNLSTVCKADGTNCPSVQLRLLGTTGSIGGSPLTAGTCATGTSTVTGAVVGHTVGVSASDGTLPNPLVVLAASVTAANTVSVQVCAIAAVTPTAVTYNVSTY